MDITPVEFDPFSGSEIVAIIPSTESQLEIWLSCKIGGDDASRGFNESISIRFTGDLNRPALEEALLSLIYRHESLHSAFNADGTQMLVFREMPFNYHFMDISGLEAGERQVAEKKYVAEDALYVFDLLNGPLFKFSLLKLGEREHLFTYTAHHIVCDGWSFGIILQDLGKLYSAYSRDMMPDMAEPELFSTYAAERAEFVKTQEYKENLEYWVGKYSGSIPRLHLPLDSPRPLKRTYTSTRNDYSLDPELAEALRKLGAKEGCSFVNTLMAAFELFIFKISGQNDIVVGLPAADQPATGYFNMVGHCVNLLPLRTDLDPGENFLQYIRRRKSALLDAYDHQRFTFGSLVRNLKIARDTTRVPIIPVVFNIDMEMDKDVDFYGLQFHVINNPKEFRNFELSLNVWGSDKAITLEWYYNTILFKSATIDSMMAEFSELIRLITAHRESPIGQYLSQVSADEIAKRQHIADPSSAEERDRNYWLDILGKGLPVLEFPLDKPRLASAKGRKATAGIQFDKATVQRLDTLFKTNGASFNSGLLSVLALLLYKYTSQDELLIGDIWQSKPLFIRVEPDENSSFKEWLEKINGQVLKASQHTAYSYKELLKDLRLDSAGNRHPFTDVMLQTGPDAVDSDSAVADMLFKFNHHNDELALTLEYNAELFTEASVKRTIRHFESLCKVVVQEPLRAVGELDYIAEEEKSQLLQMGRGKKMPYPGKTLIDLFEDLVQSVPRNTAIVFEGKKLSYEELNAVANRLGHYLRSKYHIRPDEFVAVMLPKSEWLMVAIMGILKSGAAYVPIEPDYPRDRVDYILSDSGCRLIIDEHELSAFINAQDNYSSDNPAKVTGSDNLLYLIYTSGSTGKPKAVIITHRNMVNYVYWFKTEWAITSADSSMLLSSITFDGVKTSVFGALLSGAALHIMSKDILQSPKELAAYINREGITFIKITPPLLNLMVSDDESFRLLTSSGALRLFIIGGEKINAADVKKIKANSKISMLNHYGPTETTVGVITRKIESLEGIELIGKPIYNTDIHVLDSKGRLAPVGVYGEICIAGDGLARGYLNKPELSNEKFVDDPYRTGDKMYKTGDIGRWLDSGDIEFAGRRDHQVKVRGYRIELGEIENTISHYHGIEAVTVLAVEQENGDNVLCAYMVSSSGVDIKELKKFMEGQLPNYMVPNSFVLVNEIPLTHNGKIDRRKLMSMGGDALIFSLGEEDMPVTEDEKLIAAMWKELLGISQVGRRDNFFELGGHSLIAIRFIIRLENELGVRFPMSSLFEYPTVEKIAGLMSSQNMESGWKTLVPIQPEGSKPPLYLVHGGGLGVLIFRNIAHLDKEQPIYGVQAVGFDGHQEPLKTVEEMASLYVTELIEQNPAGPYLIAGHSAGGAVAYEMARILNEQGRNVQYLGIFDYDLNEALTKTSIRRKLRRKTLGFFPALLFNLKNLFKDPKRAIEHHKVHWEMKFVRMRKRLGMERKDVFTQPMAVINKAVVAFSEALDKFRPKPYDGIINLFVSLDKIHYQDDPRYLGWKPYALKGIKVHYVEGDHDEMILPPNNFNFARILQESINDSYTNDRP